MASYLTASEIEDRLDLRFGISATIQEGDADIASDELDSMGPFIGSKLDSGQERYFPRTINPDGTENTDTAPPPAVLDWIALSAYHTTTEETPGITSESIGSTSRSYASPKISQTERRMERLLLPYFLKVGQRVGVSSASITFPTYESYPDS